MIADIVESCLNSGFRGGNNNPEGLGGNDCRMSHKSVNNDNIIIDTKVDTQKQGTSRAYTLNRLSREAPELFERVLNKELSANAAAIEAGFRKKQTPIEIIKFNWKKLNEVERQQFLSWINNDSRNCYSIY